MNQFKKAKQLRTESGQPTESITDIKTAGIVIPKETDDTQKNEKETILTENGTADDVKTEAVPVGNAVVSASMSPQQPRENEPSSAAQPAPNLQQTGFPAKTNAVIHSQTDAHPAESPESSDISLAPEDAIVPVSVTTQEPLNRLSSVQQQTESTYQLQQQEVLHVSEPEAGSKKAAPNIFTPKGEAKSMRKSLVLKPTSVRIAEAYCEKNGGSFNELIQTLLDNFIDEYDLW